MLVGFLCFESLMWIFFADLSQRFRLSPVFVFGLGRAIMAVAIMFGTLVPSPSQATRTCCHSASRRW